VSLNHVSTQSFAHRKRSLEVYGAAYAEPPQSRPLERLERSVRAEGIVAHLDHGEIDAIDRNRIADPSTLKDFLRFDYNEGAIGPPLNATYAAHFYYESGEDSHV